MATNNSVNSPLSGTTGTGNFVGSTSPSITTPSLGTLNDTSSQAMLQFIPSAGGNWITMENLSTPRVTAAGAGSNIGITLKAKGDASISLVTASTTYAFQVYSGASSAHNTLLYFPTSSATTSITFPDLTGTVQLSSNTGTSGQVLTSNGTGVAPSYQTAASGADAAFSFLLMGG